MNENCFSEIKLMFDKKLESFSNENSSLSNEDFLLIKTIGRAFSESKHSSNRYFKNVQSIPKLKMTKDELLKLVRNKKIEIREENTVMNWLRNVTKSDVPFEYKRLCFDKYGIPIKTSKNKWKTEFVSSEEPLFSVSWIYSHKKSKLKHIEISPAKVFVDLIESRRLFEFDMLIDQSKSKFKTEKVFKIFRCLLLYFFRNFTHGFGEKKEIEIDLPKISELTGIKKTFLKTKKTRAIKNLKIAIEEIERLGFLQCWSFFDEDEKYTFVFS